MSSPSRPWWLLAPVSVSPLWWLAVVPVLLAVDDASGLTFEFIPLYVVPVTMAAWYSGRGAGVAVAAAFPLGRAVLLSIVHTQSMLAVMQMTLGAVLVLGFLALAFARFAEHERRLERQIRVLEGLLPICSVCKSIRDTRGQWTRLEAFIQERSDAKFSHGLCPSCATRHYDEPGEPVGNPSVRADIVSAVDRLR